MHRRCLRRGASHDSRLSNTRLLRSLLLQLLLLLSRLRLILQVGWFGIERRRRRRHRRRGLPTNKLLLLLMLLLLLLTLARCRRLPRRRWHRRGHG